MSRYPENFDGDDNLYLVGDKLQVPLGFDYYPGHDAIVADGDISNKFPPSGIITLVDQCSTPKERAISLRYGSRTKREFLDLELLPDSVNCFKPKKITTITMQVMADHREALKDAIFSIEKYLGTKHQVDDLPKGDTIFGRINFLRKVVFSPKAWFEIENTTGVAPFTTRFVFSGTGNTGPVGDISYTWKFNDEEYTTTQPVIERTFLSPGNYTISLTMRNHYGEDTVTFVNAVKVKDHAPEPLAIKFVPNESQMLVDNKLRTPVNQPVSVELIKSEKDLVTSYTWNLGDDLPHSNSLKTKALYSTGGKFDVNVRSDTDLGSYRVSTHAECVDVVDPINAWIWQRTNNIIRSYEFGLKCEVLKTSNNTYTLNANDKFIEATAPKKQLEFWRSNGSSKQSDVSSGNGGICTVFWASGRSPHDEESAETINLFNYNGFTDIYETRPSLQKPWNWAALTSGRDIYFVLGNKEKTQYDSVTGTATTETLDYKNMKGGAHDLLSGYGYYRTAWKDSVGYILKQEIGEYYSFHSFYKTEGTLGRPFKNLIKLPDMPGDYNKEGSLVAMTHGIYFFNNAGATYCFNDKSGVWELVNPHNKIARNELNSLLAASDGESSAIISIENTAFFKFNEIDMSYVNFNHSPFNGQWLMTIY